jgi:hypothetical protein
MTSQPAAHEIGDRQRRNRKHRSSAAQNRRSIARMCGHVQARPESDRPHETEATIVKTGQAKQPSIPCRSFARGSLFGMASLWLNCLLRSEHLVLADRASRFINPLIGASSSVLLGEGKIFSGPTTPFAWCNSVLTRSGAVKDPRYSSEGDNAPG